MLSRIAESCYWIGRLVERADYTARLLDVHYHNLLQNHPQESKRLAKHLVDVMGTAQTSTWIDVDDAVAYIGFDPHFAGSISDTIAQLAENAKGVRDTIPSELFEAIYATHGDLTKNFKNQATTLDTNFSSGSVIVACSFMELLMKQWRVTIVIIISTLDVAWNALI